MKRINNIKKILFIIIIAIMISFIFTNNSLAAKHPDEEGYFPPGYDDGWTSSKSSGDSDLSGLSGVNKLPNSGSLADITGNIIGVIYVVAAAVSVVMLLVIGIKYMMASPDQKASLKARAVPYLIGAALIFGAANILRFIETISTWIK